MTENISSICWLLLRKHMHVYVNQLWSWLCMVSSENHNYYYAEVLILGLDWRITPYAPWSVLVRTFSINIFITRSSKLHFYGARIGDIELNWIGPLYDCSGRPSFFGTSEAIDLRSIQLRSILVWTAPMKISSRAKESARKSNETRVSHCECRIMLIDPNSGTYMTSKRLFSVFWGTTSKFLCSKDRTISKNTVVYLSINVLRQRNKCNVFIYV